MRFQFFEIADLNILNNDLIVNFLSVSSSEKHLIRN